MKNTLLLTAVLIAAASSAPAGNLIRKACLKSGRPAATQNMCLCIQKVADRRLNRKEQKLAATFFADPHQAQVIRQSDDRKHEKFWDRYKQWAAASEVACK